MALIHEQLYHADNLSHIDFNDYLQDLIQSLRLSFDAKGKDISLKIQADSVCLEINKVIPCGLIVNELVTNALKYAFPDPAQQDKTVWIVFTQKDESLLLSIRDNGTGLPEDIELDQSKNLGLRLVKLLVERQLRGTIQVDRTEGSRFEILFNL
jgi:two-component sensor histidine kinase